MKNLVVGSDDSVAIKSERTLVDTVKLLLNTVNHVFIGFVFIYTMWICSRNGFQLIFTWHVILSVLGVRITNKMCKWSNSTTLVIDSHSSTC